MKIDIITLFPRAFVGPFEESIVGHAQQKGVVEIRVTNLRDFALDKRKTVDDTPFGGGAGMVLKPDVLLAAIEAVRTAHTTVILLTPQGETFSQRQARRLASERHIVLVCGHYEGVDERIRQSVIDLELSIGDFVLTSGNLAAMVIADAVTRLLPGALGSSESAETDSFGRVPVLEFPQYTRPADFRGMCVPEVLLSGDHARIDAWRREQSMTRTISRRPDLLLNRPDGDE